VLIGQSAQGNPWLFAGKESLKRSLQGGAMVSPPSAPGLADRFAVMLEHSRYHEDDPRNPCFFGMRKNLLWYCRGFDGAEELRWHMKRADSARDVARALENFTHERFIAASQVPMASNVPTLSGV
jgi:tRNA-dihydrouridine synthase